jgi:diaminohydroxyphosphoribosylaminopyrimidine deaminase/5-amino-6-(5-phosphoribosylamino)uracil reductase
LVTLKIARGADGKTVPSLGADRWITGAESRRFAHLLRARHDAILIGVGTALADDPMLDCRLPGLEDRSPVRIVLDSRLRLPESARLVCTARAIPTIVFTVRDDGDGLRAQGVEVLRVVRDHHGRVALEAVLGVLAGRGFTRLLVEGGATVISAFLKAGFADRLEIFTAEHSLAERGTGVIAELAEPALSAGFACTGTRRFGPDVLESYAAKA